MIGVNSSIGIGVITKSTTSVGIPIDFIAIGGEALYALPKPAKNVIVIINNVPQRGLGVEYTFNNGDTNVVYIAPLVVGDYVQITPFY